MTPTPLPDRSTEVTEVLRTELARHLGCDPTRIDLTARLTELPGVESIRLINTVVACERHWKIHLDPDALATVTTVEDLRDLFTRTLPTP